MIKKFLVTTPIYYPNDKLHIGHAYTSTLADYLSRYKKMDGYQTFYLTGSDEHGQKIENRAKEMGKNPLTFVTEIIKTFKDLWLKLGIDYDKFIRTTDKEHMDFVRLKFTELYEKDFIYKGEYSGYYCKVCEAFFTEKQLINGNCPDCKEEVELISEESYFLKISEFKDWVKNKLEDGKTLLPKHRVTELVNNFVNNLKDLSITRTSFDWGIKTNEDQDHVIYVWLDALLNYISAFTYKDSSWTVDEVWGKDSSVELVQLVGKEITRFHCIYWPILLHMLNYRDTKIFAHGWLVTLGGDKMSKSKGNVIDPIELIEVYGRDALRFFLINNIVTGEDGKFSENLLIENINGLLVNKYANLVSRTDAMVKKYFNGVVPIFKESTEYENQLKNNLDKLKNNYMLAVENLELSNSTKFLIKYSEEINNYIDNTIPWVEKNEDKLSTIMNTLINEIYNLSILFSPILIDTTQKVFDWLSVSDVKFKDLDRDLNGTTLKDVEHLFERIK